MRKREVMELKCRAQSHPSMPHMEEVLDRMTCLPPAPQVLPRLLGLLSNADVDLSAIVELITLDPALTAKVLQQSNSAYFGAPEPAHDIGEAVNRLGLQATYRLVAVVSGSSVLHASRSGCGVDPAALWKHSVTVALASQHVAQDAGQDASLAFTGGLLHDLGKVLMAEAFQERYAAVGAEVLAEREEFAGRERAAFGFHHAELAGHLLARWKFQPEIVSAVRHHHLADGAASLDPMTACLILANAVAYQLDLPEPAVLSPAGQLALLRLGWPADRLACYLERTREDFAFIDAVRHIL